MKTIHTAQIAWAFIFIGGLIYLIAFGPDWARVSRFHTYLKCMELEKRIEKLEKTNGQMELPRR